MQTWDHICRDAGVELAYILAVLLDDQLSLVGVHIVQDLQGLQLVKHVQDLAAHPLRGLGLDADLGPGKAQGDAGTHRQPGVNGTLLVKRVKRNFDGSVLVSSDNGMYPPDVIKDDMVESLNVVGRVVWCGRRM